MLKAAIIIYVMQGIGILCAMVTVSIVTSYFSPEEYGRFTLYLSLIVFGGMLMCNWAQAAFLRFGREEWTKEFHLGRSLATLFWFMLVGTSIGGVVAWFAGAEIASFLSVEDSPWFLLLLGMFAIALPIAGKYAGQATDRPFALGIAPFLRRVIFLVGIIASGYYFNEASWEQLAWWYILAASIGGGVCFLLLPKTAWQNFTPSKELAAKWVRYGWTMPLATASAVIVQWVDGWVIRYYIDTAAVGLYNWAYQIVDLATISFGTLSMLVIPKLIDANINKNKVVLENYAALAFRLVTLCICVLIMLLPFVLPLMNLLIDPAYHPAYPLLLFMLGVLPFLLLGFLASPIAQAFETLVKKWVLFSVTLSLINIILDLLLIPFIGSIGAVIATGTAFLVAGLGQIWTYSHYLDVKLLPLGNILLLCSFLIACCLSVVWNDNPWLNGVLCFSLASLILLRYKPFKNVIQF